MDFSCNSEINHVYLKQEDETTHLVHVDAQEPQTGQPVTQHVSECVPQQVLNVSLITDLVQVKQEPGDSVEENVQIKQDLDVQVKAEPLDNIYKVHDQPTNLNKTEQDEGGFETVVLKQEHESNLSTDNAVEYNKPGGGFNCKKCGKHTVSLAELILHSKAHLIEVLRLFTCKICKHIFEQQASLDAHMETHKEEKCAFCDFRTYEIHVLTAHVSTHKSQLFNCTECSFSTHLRSFFKDHVESHTSDIPYNRKLHECTQCDYKSRNQKHLTVHIRTHTGEKPYHCSKCGYKSCTYGNLIAHRRTHTCDKPYKCDLCDYKTVWKSSLVAHSRVHDGSKPFHCAECEYKSKNRGGLAVHMRIHTGEKPYCCNKCDYKCRNRSNLVAHMRTHTGEKRFRCTRCSYGSTRKRLLVKHLTTHSGEAAPQDNDDLDGDDD